MKTTIEISEFLLEQARLIAARENTTLRELIEAGLRTVIAEADLTPSRSWMKTKNAIRNILTAQKLAVPDIALHHLKNAGRK